MTTVTASSDARGPIARGLPVALGLTLFAGLWLGGVPLLLALALCGGIAGWEWHARVRGVGTVRTLRAVAGWIALALAALGLILVRGELGLGAAVWTIAVPLSAMAGAAIAHNLFATQEERRPRRGPQPLTTTHWVGALIITWVVAASIADRIGLTGVRLWSGLPGAALTMGAVALVRRVAPPPPPALVAAHRLRVRVLDAVAPFVPMALIAGLLTATGHLSIPIR